MGDGKLLRGIPTLFGIPLLIAVICSPLRAEFPPLECPKECACHYFRIHWVADCSMRGLKALPTGQSPSVYILDLSRNSITGKNDSLKFPESSKVRRLHLAENKLTEVTRDTFAGLSYLLEVDLSGNSIERIDRNAFVDSPGLISLELRRNLITGPENGKAFVNSKSLKSLDLSDCRLRHLSRGFFDESTSISELDLSGNPLESIDSDSLEPLAGLEKLQLNRCLLSSISPNLLQRSQHLKLFEAAWNPKLFANEGESKLVTLLQGLNRLDHLDLRGTGLRSIPGGSFKDTTELASLMLADNDISASSSTLPKDLANLVNINLLDLSGCHLELSSLSFLLNMTKLRTLRLGRNDLSKSQTTPLPTDPNVMDMEWSISHLTKLKKLSMDHCELQRFPLARSFASLSNVLVELDVSDNPLQKQVSKFPEKILEDSPSSLKETHFNSLKEMADSVQKLRVLQNLDMSRCNITQLPKETFSQSVGLRRLSLSGNLLTRVKDGKRVPGLEEKLLAAAHRLEILELADCGFTELPAAEAMPETKRDEDYALDVDRKRNMERIDDDEDSIIDSADDETGPYLRELNLAGNPLALNGPFPPYVSSLTKLDLSRCGLSVIPSDTFLWAVNLTDLSLAGNPLGSAGKTMDIISRTRHTPVPDTLDSEGGFHQKNDLADNNKTSTNASYVEILHVDDKIITPDLSFIYHLPNIRSLDLRRCSLTSLSHSSISNVSLQSLRLAGNPWICGCQLVNLWDWASSSGKDILLHRPPPAVGSTVLAAASVEEEHGLRCTARDGTRIPWFKYVLSSHQHRDCGPLPAKLVVLASRMHQEPSMASSVFHNGDNISGSWTSTALACSLGVLSLILLIGAFCFMRSRGRNCKIVSPAPQGNALLLDEEELGSIGTVRWAATPYRETTQS